MAQETEKIKIPHYSMKMQIYPTAVQKEKIDKIFRALHIAYNITFHEVFQKNPEVCTEPNDNNDVWPDYNKMAKAAWRKHLIECNSAVAEAPTDALYKKNGLFLSDAKRAWQTGMRNRPVNAEQRKDFHFYNSAKPRTSFMVQMPAKNLVPSCENEKVAYLKISGIAGKVKARGFNRKIWFGENGAHTYSEAVENGEVADQLSVRVSKDNCGSYYVSVTFSDGKLHDRKIYLETPVRKEPEPIGVDVGIKDIAILSNGQKIENKHFKRQKDKTLRQLNQKLSRRWGPANMAFRDYNRDIRKINRQNPEAPPQPPAPPSKRYLATQQKKARLERKIARRRNSYYDQQTAKIVHQSSMIAIESLLVKNMLRNHKLAYALGDAAMSDFLSKIKYKAERNKIEIKQIGGFEPSSQLCSVCGERNPQVKDLSVRSWVCPACGAEHDRDVNAAKNILKIALTRTEVTPDRPPDAAVPEETPEIKKKPRRQSVKCIYADIPEIVVVYSRELTRLNDPRYIIVNKDTNEIIDDAQGAGYRSISNAKNCYKAKRKWSEKMAESLN